MSVFLVKLRNLLISSSHLAIGRGINSNPTCCYWTSCLRHSQRKFFFVKLRHLLVFSSHLVIGRGINSNLTCCYWTSGLRQSLRRTLISALYSLLLDYMMNLIPNLPPLDSLPTTSASKHSFLDSFQRYTQHPLRHWQRCHNQTHPVRLSTNTCVNLLFNLWFQTITVPDVKIRFLKLAVGLPD